MVCFFRTYLKSCLLIKLPGPAKRRDSTTSLMVPMWRCIPSVTSLLIPELKFPVEGEE